jgi:hypothetical protein
MSERARTVTFHSTARRVVDSFEQDCASGRRTSACLVRIEHDLKRQPGQHPVVVDQDVPVDPGLIGLKREVDFKAQRLLGELSVTG